MRRAAKLSLTLLSGLLLAACSDERPTPTSPKTAPDALADVTIQSVGDPVPGLTTAQLAAFTRGKAIFQQTFTQSGGLGPIFNASSCVECHGEASGLVGGTGD